MDSEPILEASVIGRAPDDNTISQYIYEAAISWAPLQSHKTVASLSAYPRIEHDASTSAARIKLEGTDARVPVETAEDRLVFIRMPEGCAVDGINHGHAIISPAI